MNVSNQFQMSEHLLQAKSNSHITALNKNPDANSEEDLEAVAKEFESLFMNMILKSMRSANRAFSEGSYFDSFESRMYEDMLDEKMSRHLGDSKSLGIADLLVQQLRGSETKARYDMPMGVSASLPTSVPTRKADFESANEFISTLLPKVQSGAKELGVAPEHIVAQAALETGWGSHLMFDDQGRNSHNLFGIKAKQDWDGKTVAIESLEVKQGVASKERSQFKVYESYDAAIEDYVNLLGSSERYKGSLGSGNDIGKFAEGLRAGGYATDPEYANKLTRVLGNSGFSNIQLAKGVD